MDLRIFVLTAIAFQYCHGAERCFTPDVAKLLKKAGDSVSLYCSSGNEHMASILRKDDQVIPSGSNSIVEGGVANFEKVLRILNVTHANEGSYTCSSTDSRSDACTPVELKVYDEITFPKESKETLQYIQAGRTGTINCTSASTPEPTHEWYVDGRKLPSRGDSVFRPEGKNLHVVSAAALNSSTFTCRATLKEFGYFKDLNITLSVPEGEPLSCLKCRQYAVGKGDSVDDCVSAKDVDEQEKCLSSCATIIATGPSLDGNIRYASIRGCGDHISVFKDKCIKLPHSTIRMDALSLFGDFTGLTTAEICFCSSGDKCNNKAKNYQSLSHGVALKGGIAVTVAAICVIILILKE